MNAPIIRMVHILVIMKLLFDCGSLEKIILKNAMSFLGIFGLYNILERILTAMQCFYAFPFTASTETSNDPE